MIRSPLFLIFLVMFVDMLGFGIILPLLPYYGTAFNAGEAMIGLLIATFPAFQLVGAPLLGRLSDRHGRKPLLLWSILGTSAGFLLLGLADALWLLFVARAVDGLTGGNISVAQAYISDAVPREERARAFGLMGAAFGLGFMIGPGIGGELSHHFGIAAPAFFAAGLALLNFVGVLLFLPETLSPERRAAARDGGKSLLSWTRTRGYLTRHDLGPLLGIGFIYRLTHSTFTTVFALYCLKRFAANEQQTGRLLMYVAFLVVLVQGGLIGWLSRVVGEARLLAAGIVVLIGAYLGWAFAPSVGVLMLALVPLALGSGVVNSVLQSLISKTASSEESGEVMGLAASLECVTRMVAPALNGYLMLHLGSSAPGVFGAVLLAALFPFVMRILSDLRALESGSRNLAAHLNPSEERTGYG